MIKISCTNQSTVITDAEFQQAMINIQTQANRDFAPLWGTDQVQMTFLPKTSPVPVGNYQMVCCDDSDQAGALGYHETTENGDPIGFFFAKTDQQYGESWTVTFSHEILEMIGDPFINTVIIVTNADNSLSLYAFEASDAVEADALGYQINGTLVSDFVTPYWFNPLETGRQYDYQKKCTSPLQLLPDGYIGMMSATSPGGWTQVTANRMSQHAMDKAIPQPFHRRHRRQMGRRQWRQSKKQAA